MKGFRSQPVAEQKQQEGRAWRERFVQDALANFRLEGLEPSPKALGIWQSYVEGEISVEQAGDVACLAHRKRQPRPGKASAHAVSPPVVVIGIG